MRTRVLVVAVLVVISLGTMPGTAVADDFPQFCDDAPIISGGQISGQLEELADQDAFAIRLQQGQYVSLSVDMPSEKAQAPKIFTANTREGENINNDNHVVARGVRDMSIMTGHAYGFTELHGESPRAELWAKTDRFSESKLCLIVHDKDWKTPYEWEITIERSDPDVTLFEVRELEDKVVELQNQLEENEGNGERISELESQLEQKNQRIDELESRVEELELQSSDGGGSGVSIDVTVTPANGQQNFVEGGEAIVQAESENADVSGIAVEYGAGTYQLDSSGQVAIPLADTGEQQMTVIYGDTTEEVSINVHSQQNQQQDGTTSGNSGPGFGIIATAVALLSVIAYYIRE